MATKRQVKIGRYILRKVLGEGAMGKVYLAFDPNLKRHVALKIVRVDRLNGKSSRENFTTRFLREAQIGARLQHPNIVATYDMGTHKNLPFMVMEYYGGRQLADYMGEGFAMETDRALSVLKQLGDALETAHDQGVIHRDIKPQNMILAKDGVVKILDFGIARLVGSEMTKTGEFLGSPRYASPEQINDTGVDHRSDLFSLAVMAHEMFTGYNPFPSNSINGVLSKIAKGDFRIAKLPPDSPLDQVSMLRVFGKAFRIDPNQRYQSANELVAAIEQLKGGLVGPETDRTVKIALPMDARPGADATVVIPSKELEQARNPIGGDTADTIQPTNQDDEETVELPMGIEEYPDLDELESGDELATVVLQDIPDASGSHIFDKPLEKGPEANIRSFGENDTKPGVALSGRTKGTLAALVVLIFATLALGYFALQKRGRSNPAADFQQALASGDLQKATSILRGMKADGLDVGPLQERLDKASQPVNQDDLVNKLDKALADQDLNAARQYLDQLSSQGVDISQQEASWQNLRDEKVGGLTRTLNESDDEATLAATEQALRDLGEDPAKLKTAEPEKKEPTSRENYEAALQEDRLESAQAAFLVLKKNKENTDLDRSRLEALMEDRMNVALANKDEEAAQGLADSYEKLGWPVPGADRLEQLRQQKQIETLEARLQRAISAKDIGDAKGLLLRLEGLGVDVSVARDRVEQIESPKVQEARKDPEPTRKGSVVRFNRAIREQNIAAARLEMRLLRAEKRVTPEMEKRLTELEAANWEEVQRLDFKQAVAKKDHAAAASILLELMSHDKNFSEEAHLLRSAHGELAWRVFHEQSKLVISLLNENRFQDARREQAKLHMLAGGDAGMNRSAEDVANRVEQSEVAMVLDDLRGIKFTEGERHSLALNIRGKNAYNLYKLGYDHRYGRNGRSKNERYTLAYMRLAAERDVVEAQYVLADYFLRGDIVRRDPAIARLWFSKAAAQGYDRAQFEMGNLYYSGNGVNEDLSKALTFYKAAAVQDNPEAQFMVGSMYEKGIGVDPSLSEARVWYDLAAAKNNKDAIRALRRLKR